MTPDPRVRVKITIELSAGGAWGAILRDGGRATERLIEARIAASRRASREFLPYEPPQGWRIAKVEQ